MLVVETEYMTPGESPLDPCRPNPVRRVLSMDVPALLSVAKGEGSDPSPESHGVERTRAGRLLASEETAEKSGAHLDHVVHGTAVAVCIEKAGEHIDCRG